MNKIFLFLVLIGLGFSQTTDLFEITPKKGLNRKLIKGATVYIVNTSTLDSLLLSEYTGTKAGTYYRAATSFGTYKVYVQESGGSQTLVKSNHVFGATTAMLADSSITSAKIAESVYHVADSTALKASSISTTGYFIWMDSLSATNPNGGGLFTLASKEYAYLVLGDSINDAGTIFDSGDKRWIRFDAISNKHIDPNWYGAYSDSTNPTSTLNAFNLALTEASQRNKMVYVPSGKYAVNGTIRIWHNTKMKGAPDTYIIANGTDPLIYPYSDGTDTGASDSTQNNAYFGYLNLRGQGALSLTVAPGGNDGALLVAGQTAHGWNYYKVKIEFIDVRNFDKEAIQVWDAKFVTITDCYGENINHDFLNPARCQHITVLNNKSYRTRYGLEGYSKYIYPSDGDSISSAQIQNNQFIWSFLSSIRWYGSFNGFTEISNNYITGIDTITSSASYSTGDGIRISHTFVHSAQTRIINNSIANSIFNGINLYSSGSTYTTDRIIIEGNHVENTGTNGISLSDDSLSVSYLKITKNEIYNWNKFTVSNSVTLTGIYLRYIDSVEVSNNTIWNTRTTANQKNPVIVRDGINAKIINNDFRSPDGSGVLIYSDTYSSQTLVSSNNDGLSYNRGYYDYQTTTGYYQQSKADTLGNWFAKSRSTVGFLQTTILDTACIVRYNSSAVAVDTLRIFPAR